MATAEQITEDILNWFIDMAGVTDPYFLDAWSEFSDEIQWDTKKSIKLASGNASFVKKVGGEGKGEEYWILFKVGEEFFKVDGYYSSWDGVSWEGSKPYKVKPVEVTVIEYEKVDE